MRPGTSCNSFNSADIVLYSPELTRAGGKYVSTSKVVREALGDWMRSRAADQRDLAALRQAISAGDDSGAGIPPRRRIRGASPDHRRSPRPRVKRLVFSPAAQAGLVAIALYIAEDNPDRAISFVADLEDKAHQAAERPASFPARDDASPGLRAAKHGRYLLFFRESQEEVRIVRVLHGARDLPRTLLVGE